MLRFVSSFSRLREINQKTKEVWNIYLRSLEGYLISGSFLIAKKPILTKSISYGILMGIGDAGCQQLIERRADPTQQYDVLRTAKLSMLGFVLSGPLFHHWFKFLEKTFPGASTKQVLKKLSLDQFVFAPIAVGGFVSIITALSRPDLAYIKQKLANDLIPTLKAQYFFWVPANFINFQFVPPQLRVLYLSFLAVFWNGYLSYMSNKPVPQIKEK